MGHVLLGDNSMQVVKLYCCRMDTASAKLQLTLRPRTALIADRVFLNVILITEVFENIWRAVKTTGLMVKALQSLINTSRHGDVTAVSLDHVEIPHRDPFLRKWWHRSRCESVNYRVVIHWVCWCIRIHVKSNTCRTSISERFTALVTSPYSKLRQSTSSVQ